MPQYGTVDITFGRGATPWAHVCKVFAFLRIAFRLAIYGECRATIEGEFTFTEDQ